MDDRDFTTLVEPYLLDALRIAAAMVGVAEAEDIVQEASIRAWQAWPSLRDTRSVRAWFFRILVNTCHNWHKSKAGARQNANQSLDEKTLLTLAIEGNEPGTADHAAALDLYQAINRLRDNLRSVVVLRYFAGFDASEIGQMLEIPASTVRTRLRRAMTILHNGLDHTPQPGETLSEKRS